MREALLGSVLILLSVGAKSQTDDEHFILQGFDKTKDTGYLSTIGFINRPDLGVVIPVNVQKDGSILLGDPPVDRVPADSVKRAVCGQTIEFDGLPQRTLLCQ
jgi:hypothetical protein